MHDSVDLDDHSWDMIVHDIDLVSRFQNKGSRSANLSLLGSDMKSILSMNADEARDFLMKPTSYCDLDLPKYFDFGPLLSAVASVMKNKPLAEMAKKAEARQRSDVNYTILTNKDGRYAWRPIQLIHPAIYIALVNKITEDAHWATIIARFEEFA
jgi:RNA-directed DNA polymerase